MLVQATGQPTYAGCPVVTMELPAQALGFTSNVAGLGNVSYPISAAGVFNFTARFGGAFHEVRIIGAYVDITPLTNATGVTCFAWSESSVSTRMKLLLLKEPETV